jgi:hypothetical protein
VDGWLEGDGLLEGPGTPPRNIDEWQAFQRQLSEEVMTPLNVDDRRQLIRLLERIRKHALGE